MKYCALILFAAGISSAAEFETGQAARSVIGQVTFTAQDPGGGTNGASPSVLGGVGGIAYANGMLFAVDSNRVSGDPQNNRVLIFTNYPAKQFGPSDAITTTGRCPLCGGTASVVLGQPDTSSNGIALTQNGMRTPTAVASDGQHIAVADTDNNRVLVWNSIPNGNGANADVVVGQPDFTTATMNFGSGNAANAKGLRGPQGVWFQGGKLYVADTQNHRVLIWNSIPTSNAAPADIVLGQASFTNFVNPDLTQGTVAATASNMLNPVSVTSDGIRLFVADLGHNRVLIWNTIPTASGAPADVVLGQPALATTSTVPASFANNSQYLCPSNGTDSTTNLPTYPARCAATLDWPRFALSDGQRLFIADGGNSRVLVYKSIPTTNGYAADIILGEPDDATADDGTTANVSAADTLRTPTSMAWDGTNLYVSDTYNRRIVVYSPGDTTLARTAIRNLFSREVFSTNTIVFGGTVKSGDTATITITSPNATTGRDYTYTITSTDTVNTVITNMVNLINNSNNNAGDPDVIARSNLGFQAIVLTARQAGSYGDNIGVTTSVSANAVISLTALSPTLFGSRNAANIAPGTLLLVSGSNFTDQTVSAPSDATNLPTTLGGLQLYVDGTPAPLLSVSPTEIHAQAAFEISDATSSSVYIRSVSADGKTVTVSVPVGMPIIPDNPGILAGEGTDPRPAVAYHTSSYAQGVVAVDGVINAGDVATITIEDRSYNYTVLSTDILETVRNGLINAINANPNEKVRAYAGGFFSRVRLQSNVPGKEGEGIPYTASVSTGAQLTLSPYNTVMCCSNVAGALVTPDNPAVPGESIIFYGTGLGLSVIPSAVVTGEKYPGPSVNPVVTSVDAVAGGSTAVTLSASPGIGMVGVYPIELLLNSGLPTNPQTQVGVAQDINISNTTTIPVQAPASTGP